MLEPWFSKVGEYKHGSMQEILSLLLVVCLMSIYTWGLLFYSSRGTPLYIITTKVLRVSLVNAANRGFLFF